jgi:hypothetical protein
MTWTFFEDLLGPASGTMLHNYGIAFVIRNNVLCGLGRYKENCRSIDGRRSDFFPQ